MNKFLYLIIFFSSAVWLAGCATPSDQISLKKISPKQRFYTGRMNIKLNGVPASKCEVYLNYDVAPSIQLSDSGFIVYKTDRENIHFKKIACQHAFDKSLSAWHIKALNLAAVEKPSEQSTVHYFGDVNIDWAIDPEQTKEAAYKDYDSKTYHKVGRVNDSGEMKITITADLPKIEKEFYGSVVEAKDKNWILKETILKASH
jgi:hypothetical protein